MRIKKIPNQTFRYLCDKPITAILLSLFTFFLQVSISHFDCFLVQIIKIKKVRNYFPPFSPQMESHVYFLLKNIQLYNPLVKL